MSPTATAPTAPLPAPAVAGRPAPGDIDVVAIDRPSVRPLHPSDAPRLAEFFASMSDESRRRRFFQAMPRVSRSMIDYLSRVDQQRHLALAAVVERPAAAPTGRLGDAVEELIVGEARAVRERDRLHVAELAVAVHDRWHRRGVASTLLDELYRRLEQLGVTRVSCEVLPDNRASIDLFRRYGVEFRFEDGVLRGSGPVRHGAGSSAPSVLSGRCGPAPAR